MGLKNFFRRLVMAKKDKQLTLLPEPNAVLLNAGLGRPSQEAYKNIPNGQRKKIPIEERFVLRDDGCLEKMAEDKEIPEGYFAVLTPIQTRKYVEEGDVLRPVEKVPEGQERYEFPEHYSVCMRRGMIEWARKGFAYVPGKGLVFTGVGLEGGE